MRVVVFASVFPDSAADRRALGLARHASVTAVVPTPWVPRPLAGLSARRGGDVARLVGPECGYLVPAGDPSMLAAAVGAALRGTWNQTAIRRHVAGMTWERTAEATHHFLEAAVSA